MNKMVYFKRALDNINELKYRFFRRFYDATPDDFNKQRRNHAYRKLERYDNEKGRGRWRR